MFAVAAAVLVFVTPALIHAVSDPSPAADRSATLGTRHFRVEVAAGAGAVVPRQLDHAGHVTERVCPAVC